MTTTSTRRRLVFIPFKSIQWLANAADRTKFESVVAGITLQMKGDGTPGTWYSIVDALICVHHTYQHLFSALAINRETLHDTKIPHLQPGRPQVKIFKAGPKLHLPPPKVSSSLQCAIGSATPAA